MAEQLTQEGALNLLDQAGMALEKIVKAKEAINAAITADQNRVNLENQNAKLKEDIQSLKQQRQDLAVAMDQELANRQADLADMTDTVNKQLEADKAANQAILTDLKKQIMAKQKAMQRMEMEYQDHLQDLKAETAQAEERLNQVRADYEQIKAKFIDV
jgi:predicted  nucleic acid-binding Zn-ribbon protein